MREWKIHRDLLQLRHLKIICYNNIMRTESLKLAQKKYYEKIKNDPIFIEKRKLSQQKYRQKKL